MLEIAKLVGAAIAKLPEVAGEPLTLVDDRGELADPCQCDSRLELLEQPLRDRLLVRSRGEQAQSIDPGGDGRACRQDGADQPSVPVGDEHDRSLITQQANCLFDLEPRSAGIGRARLFPELEDLGEVA